MNVVMEILVLKEITGQRLIKKEEDQPQ